MAKSINLDLFWEILSEIQGNTTDLTEAMKAIAKSDQGTAQQLMDIVVDQIAYNSPDWQRVKNLLRDWYASHRTVTSYQANISDPYQLPNDQLDELFRSFGYKLSSILKNPTNNELPPGKVNFFLDLVNLYKRKGTPQSLVDVLRYYGITQVDVYELQLQYEERLTKDLNDFIFKGKLAAGTTGDDSPIYLPFNFLTDRDPHWFQTEDQIRHLITQNKINFPSTSPYFSVKPMFDEEAMDAATGIISRRVQDQYAIWNNAGRPKEDLITVLPQDVVITILGQTSSMLTLYLSVIYTFNKEYHVGADATSFICYDGTNTDSFDIIDEFNALTNQKILTRAEWNTRWLQYNDIFSRPIESNFLQNALHPGQFLELLNPTIKNQLDSLATDNVTVLGTLLRDLGEWVRSNISYGFINMSYILFGLDSLFAQLSSVIDFWKPYRARLVPLETIQFRNRLFNSVIVEDQLTLGINQEIHDFITGDSHPCCTDQGIDSSTPICIDSTSTNLYYSRETYDCGSWHDIGAVTDMPQEIFIEFKDNIHDALRCPAYYGDGTAAIHNASYLDRPFAPIVHSELLDYMPMYYDISQIGEGLDYVSGTFRDPRPNLGYALTLNMFNNGDANPSVYTHIITSKTLNGYTAKFSDVMDSGNYFVSCDYDNSDNSGIINIPDGTNRITVSIPPPPEIIDQTSYTVAISLSNTVDANPSTYSYSVVDRNISSFTVQFSGDIDSSNYYLEWILIAHEKQDVIPLLPGWTSVVVPLDPHEVNDNYGLSITLLNDVDATSSIIPFIITDKKIDGFEVRFESPIDSPNYSLMWSRPLSSSRYAEEYSYYQSGAFTNFDGVPAYDGTAWVYVEGTEGHFDCTHGFDLVQIEIQDLKHYLLQENGDYLLQEDNSRILLSL
jgi:hypothetical protein